MATRTRKGRKPLRSRMAVSPEQVKGVKDEMQGALWALQNSLDWVTTQAKDVDDQVLVEELDQIGEWLYYLADRLCADKESKPWDGSPIPLSGKPIALIQRWLGIEGLARIGEELEDE